MTTTAVWSSLVSHLRNAATVTRCIRHSHSQPSSVAGRAFSAIPPATFFGCRSLDSKSDLSKCASSLYTCAGRGQGAVLASGFTPGTLQIRCYQTTLRPRLICPGCYFVWRHERKFVECSDHPRHKQRKTVCTRKVWQEDYSKGNISVAADFHKRHKREFLRLADRDMVSHNWLAGKIGTEV